ncbi:MAG: HAD-IB family hydrolase [Gammaproteobacteria bacterium]|nr:HAD-IB family hydrolase [Gammaproteobacteria bacterium]
MTQASSKFGRSSAARTRYLARLRQAEAGPHVAALFDFDGTIIAGYSAPGVLQEKFRRGQMSLEEMVGTTAALTQYWRGKLGFAGLMAVGAKYMKGVREEDLAELGEELYEKRIAGRIYPETREIIRAHQAKGHTVAIVSSATVYQVAPAARDLGIERILCSNYEVVNGEFTGNVVPPLCFGPGKVTAAESLASELGLDLERSYFYSDSHDDIELLERVGRPRPLNPDAKLLAIAAQRRWPVQRFESRGTPGVFDYVRALTTTPALVGAFLAGLPLWALTGSTREAANFSLAAFGDYGSALVGLDLRVRGERNLWRARPCIFLFNHQSRADVLVLAKLVRRDFTGVAKREMRDVPVVGKLLEWAGVVFVDRANARDAIQAMQPLVDAIRRDGRSVCIAPEGTRSLTAELGPFKKGAFHLAVQAGVPIVPVVIHNSADVQPRNEFAMRPATVRVEVLPPVDTSHWRAASIEAHVREVRNLFLRCLGQPEQPAVPRATAKPPSARRKAAKARKPARATRRARYG